MRTKRYQSGLTTRELDQILKRYGQAKAKGKPRKRVKAEPIKKLIRQLANVTGLASAIIILVYLLMTWR